MNILVLTDCFTSKFVEALRENLNKIYVKHTGQDIKKIEEYLDRDSFLGPEEAKSFGLIDKIVTKREDLKPK